MYKTAVVFGQSRQLQLVFNLDSGCLLSTKTVVVFQLTQTAVVFQSTQTAAVIQSTQTAVVFWSNIDSWGFQSTQADMVFWSTMDSWGFQSTQTAMIFQPTQTVHGCGQPKQLWFWGQPGQPWFRWSCIPVVKLIIPGREIPPHLQRQGRRSGTILHYGC